MKQVEVWAWWLVVVGGLNWGLVGLGNWLGMGNWNVVEMLVGSWAGLSDIVYVLVGLSAVAFLWKKVAK